MSLGQDAERGGHGYGWVWVWRLRKDVTGGIMFTNGSAHVDGAAAGCAVMRQLSCDRVFFPPFPKSLKIRKFFGKSASL